ncbi:class II histone deacetylase [Geomicrobium sediminis]|uniref:Acetoin utilization deacetylase AcuC-like enzyme n=1 Tax=Geomicrobium sediminis TaxID=1347788 RepID=A0ABS2PB10_9BACL|nr:class II histone deacetylase [Geomicrobium sediminis]MBM7632326.1 acetoin utilization deacetylase AcuC-like enzyme [Geomicrobium sediminis]
MKKSTGFIYDESYFWHDNGSGALNMPSGGWVQSHTYGEDPETKRRFKNLMDRCQLTPKLTSIRPKPATREDLERFHDTHYIDRVKELSDHNGGDAGDHAIVGRGSYEIALLSAGGAITAVNAVMNGHVTNVYALTRPPGHHAEADQGMGFCLFNNVAIATDYAKEKYNLKRILVLDWDVHHGNGTEQAFYSDNEVLFISLHQDRLYPAERGYIEHIGEGAGKGYTVNIPLPAGTGNAGYMNAFEKIVEPIVNEFKPELIIISAGQDPNFFDPLARMMVTTTGFYRFSEFMKKLAEKHCDGKLVLCHEGGYSAAYVPFCSLAIVEAMSGISTRVDDPFTNSLGAPVDTLFPHEEEAVNRVVQEQSHFWSMEQKSSQR